MSTANEMILSAAEVEIEAAGKEARPKISVVAYTGRIMRVPGWGDIAIDLAGLEAGGQVPLLADHDATVGSVVGHGQPEVAGGRLVVSGVVSGAGEPARHVVEMARGGFQFQASVGVAPTEHERMKPNQAVEINGRSLSSPGGFTLVRKGRLREVSITPLGADAETSVAIAASRQGRSNMPDIANEDQIRADERGRLKQIETTCRPMGERDWGPLQKRVDDLRAKAIAGDITVADLRAGVLEVLRASRPVYSGMQRDHGAGSIPRARIIEAAILKRAGFAALAEKALGPACMEAADDLRVAHTLDLCRAALQHEGIDAPADREGMVRASLTTHTLTEALGSAVRFVIGRFGAGKSFFINLIQTVALERRHVVVRADITTDRRLNGSGGVARALYAELMKNMATRSKPEGGAMGSLVERWVSDVAHEVTGRGGTDDEVHRIMADRLKPLQELVSGYDFAAVLSAYYRGFSEHKPELQTAAIRWLRAEYSTKTEARQDLGVRSIIDDDSFYDYLKLMAAFVRIAGYKGLLVCLDELVVLSHRLNNRQARDRNYEAILRILNDCLQGGVEGLAVIFAATDDCMTDKRRGLFSYEALATRLAANRFASEQLVDLSGPVIRLANLTPEDCFVLLHNIRRVFSRGQNEETVLPEDGIVAYLESCHNRMGAAYFQTPRETIKDFVGLLNVLEQNPGTNWRQLVAAISTTAPQTPDTDPVPDEVAAPVTATPPSAPETGKAPSTRAALDDDLTSFRM